MNVSHTHTHYQNAMMIQTFKSLYVNINPNAYNKR